MNKLNADKRAQVISWLLEGMTIRDTVRITGVAKNTVTKLLVDLGVACYKYQDKVFRNLTCKRLQCDEIWSFCYKKRKNMPNGLSGVFGCDDIWTWTAICADTKIVPSWLVANRSSEAASIFIEDLAGRLTNKVQLATDGIKICLQAVEKPFGGDIDYSMLIKLFGANEDDSGEKAAKSCSPHECTDAKPEKDSGIPNPDLLIRNVERQGLTMGMSMRRHSRPANDFTKKLENMDAAVALHFMYYNFARVHPALRVTPVMAAGISGHVWSIMEIAKMLDTQ